MQFRTKVQKPGRGYTFPRMVKVIKTTYDPVKKRGVPVVVATVDTQAWRWKVRAGVSLSRAEIGEIEAWMEAGLRKAEAAELQAWLDQAGGMAAAAAAALRDGAINPPPGDLAGDLKRLARALTAATRQAEVSQEERRIAAADRLIESLAALPDAPAVEKEPRQPDERIGGTDAPIPPPPIPPIPEAPPAPPVVWFPAKPPLVVRDALHAAKFKFGKDERWRGGQLTAELREMAVKAGGKID
ncbi:MAG: hypothetical protein HQL31_06410 [Planctomycetes bacterium]|nr:hypothetical protein [Planctomycetota bacterium]